MTSGKPWITVVIATFNSAGVLSSTLESVRSQLVPEGSSGDLEILCVDGGSSDTTFKVANSFQANVLNNPFGHAIAAKKIGFDYAASDLVCFLDHDEILLARDSLRRKFEIFRDSPSILAISTSGYMIGDEDTDCNAYASEFGDPINRWIFQSPNDYRRRPKTFLKNFPGAIQQQNSIAINTNRDGFDSNLLCELVACGSVLQKSRLQESVDQNKLSMEALPNLFYALDGESKEPNFAILIDDPVGHKSVDSWKTVFKKNKWRVSNATTNQLAIGSAGLLGRLKFRDPFGARNWVLISRIISLIASMALVAPLIVQIGLLSISRRRIGYLMEFPLLYFVAYRVVIGLFQKYLGLMPASFKYDGRA